MVDLLLVNPNNKIVSPFAGIEPPLWAGLIASHYRGLGKEVAILDAEALDWDTETTAMKIITQQPEQVLIVVMGNNPSVSSTPKMKATKALIDMLPREYNIKVTGLHPSALPKETEKELGAPVVAGKIFDGTPFMPWDLLPMAKYKAHNWHCLDGSSRQPYASIYTSLGCPFNCYFCNIHALYGMKRNVWYREPRDVVKEIDTLVEKYRVRNIKFWDELFTLNKKHVEDICNRLIERKYNLNIWAYARVDSLSTTPNTLRLMKQAGINWLAYGFESGNDTVLNIAKKKINRIGILRAVSATHDVDISIIGNFIFGLPGDTEKTMQETLEFAKSLELEYVNFYTAKAYPGSILYNTTVDNKDWTQYSQYSGNNDEFKDKAFIEFFSDNDYLDRIRVKFGQQAVEQIKEMLEFGKPIAKDS